MFSFAAHADSAALNAAIWAARESCDGIHSELRSIHGMTGVNTAVTGAGTLAGAGALYAGLQKSRKDALAEEIMKQLEAIETMSDEDFFNMLGTMAEYRQLRELEDQSRNLGHWRTGLMAGTTATSIAGTMMATRNRRSAGDVVGMVRDCLESVENLRTARLKARVEEALPETDPAMAIARSIIDACDKFTVSDVERITGRTQGVQVASAIGIGTGGVGTITSAMANTNRVRDDNTDQGTQRERNLNTTANVLAGASTLTSGIATGFNVAALSALNKQMSIAKDCEDALR